MSINTLSLQIVAVDEDNARVVLRMVINKQVSSCVLCMDQPNTVQHDWELIFCVSNKM